MGSFHYPVTAWAGTFSLGRQFSPEFTHDPDPICSQERLPQYPTQHSYRPEHQLLALIAHIDDGNLAELLHVEGLGGIGSAAGDAA